MKIPRKLLQDLTTFLILFITTGAYTAVGAASTDDPKATHDGSPVMWVIWLLLYSVIALRLIPKYREVVELVRANKFLFLLILLAIVSTAWSEDPAYTFRRSLALLGTSLAGIDFAVRYSVREQLRFLYLALGLFVVLSIVVQVFFPGLVPSLDDDAAGAWHGLLGAKNSWARVIVLAAVAMLCRSRRVLSDSLLAGGLLLGAFALVLAANSRGALVVLVTMLLFFKVPAILRWSPKILTIASVAVVLLAIPLLYLLLQNLDSATALLGRDATLTGRLTLWQLALSEIARRPVLGYGYFAFWSIYSQAAMRIRGAMNWQAPHAHNGFVDITLGMGFLGLFLFLAGYAIAMVRAIKHALGEAGREAMWPAAYLAFAFLSQLTESTIVTGNSIWWILFISAACSVTTVQYSYSTYSIIESEAKTSHSSSTAIGDLA